MRFPGGGYTLIEVMIFLAISTILFVTAVLAVGGQQAHTQFRTSLDDLNSKIQQWADEVSNGFSASSAANTTAASSLKCDVSSGRPRLIAVTAGTGNERGGNPDCVFLGRAIQVSDYLASDYTHIYAYSVLGRRTDNNGDLVNDLASARPTPAVFSINGGDLTERYTIHNRTRIKWVKSGPSLTNLNSTSHLAGFFTSFSNGSSSNGSQSLLAIQYPMSSNQDAKSSAVTNCIELLSPCTPGPGSSDTNPWPMDQWVICLESTYNGENAAIDVISTNGLGVSTKVIAPCP